MKDFWNSRKVFVTGHTGFKGGWLVTWLLNMKADVTGYALKPETDPSFFKLCGLEGRMKSVIGDVREAHDLFRAVQGQGPEIVFHLAAQPIVRRSYQDALGTFATNVMGTVHLLEAVRRTSSVRAVVIVTSDKCYENREWVWGYRESDELGGRDPYSASKACAELIVSAYQRSYFMEKDSSVAVATARGGNVIGGGDWAEDRLIPDAIRAFQRNEPLVVRHPSAVRAWQHASEPLAGYLMLAERLYMEGTHWAGAWNFGPQNEGAVPVATLADTMVRLWGSGSWVTSKESSEPHEAQSLRLDSSKARHRLRWHPCLSLEQAVQLSVEWYRTALSGNFHPDMYAATVEQIVTYEALARSQYPQL